MLTASFDVGIKNLAVCVLNSADHTLVEWDVMTVDGPVDFRLVTNVIKCLALLEERVPGVELVLIERQPGRNKTMLRMEAYLHMYYASKGRKAVLISPVRKLAGSDCSFRGAGREAYKMRKKAAIALTAQFLEQTKERQPEHLAKRFAQSKKKDDLADSLLQALSYTKWPGVAAAAPCESPESPAGGVGGGGEAAAPTPTPTTTRQDVFAMVRSRRPTDKQRRSGKLSLSNIRHILGKELSKPATQQEVAQVKGLLPSILKHFKTVEQCTEALGCE